jgi:hypothetical protein
MKRLFGLIIALSIGAFILLSCEGPQGPQGPQGPAGKDGKDGKDASLSCTACHGNDKVDFLIAQYDLSRHNKGIVYEEEAGRLSCGGCHSGDGFAESIALNQDDPKTKATSKINCAACHPIHEKFEYAADFSLRVKDPIKLRRSGETYDFKTGNICARCHQARTHFDIYGADTTIRATSGNWTRLGPHYGTHANVFAMKGLYRIEGSTPIPSNNPHANLQKGCVSCHMGSLSTNPAVGGHTFKMTGSQFSEIQECKGCHADASIFTNTPKAKEIANLLKEYRQLLIDKQLLDTSQAITAEGYNLLGEYLRATSQGQKYTKEDFQVVINYLYLAKDRSLGIHNPGYVYALVKNGVEYLKK